MTFVTYLILVSSSRLCPGNHLSRNNIQVASVYSLGLPAGSGTRTIPKSGAIYPGNQRDHHTPHEPPMTMQDHADKSQCPIHQTTILILIACTSPEIHFVLGTTVGSGLTSHLQGKGIASQTHTWLTHCHLDVMTDKTKSWLINKSHTKIAQQDSVYCSRTDPVPSLRSTLSVANDVSVARSLLGSTLSVANNAS